MYYLAFVNHEILLHIVQGVVGRLNTKNDASFVNYNSI
jgi:hypothetical protein